MTLATEFPDFDATTLPEIPTHWQDVSWRNDACPSFMAFEREGAEEVRLIVFVDYLDPSEREIAGCNRFFALLYQDTDTHDLINTDDWAAVLATVEAKIKELGA